MTVVRKWQLVEAVRAAADADNVGPTMSSWRGPFTPQTIAKHLGGGSWRNALIVSGVEPPVQAWNKDRILAALREHREHKGEWPRAADWAVRATPRGARPSTGAVRRAFGNWESALAAAKAGA